MTERVSASVDILGNVTSLHLDRKVDLPEATVTVALVDPGYIRLLEGVEFHARHLYQHPQDAINGLQECLTELDRLRAEKEG